ncbi:type II toxin-antitoxin system HicB family antitoxin [Photorhabdus luminescens]|uniref:Type II toxin-antitoxin system HicB family antitoxin n=1 Tax=Photorhabdus luminescens subsp. sonorensis TaxID=1173677 RepID=A0A5C4RL33_PHOLU|nr:type II toxin-antitoxin system HicB family antitoxin [Photorhabdus luminescens]OWO82998.1 antitoxin [Photorhabdus luminescens]TNH44682.1 type II toxin-antitoxin system HicB family antitoxin [Photorhabdus luminescens subsp. sonorensis]
MRYPVNLQSADEGGFVVSFPDIPEALTQGDTREEALEMALDALITAFEFYFEDSEKVPLPSSITGDFVDVPISVAAKIMMLNTFIDSGLTQVELAERITVKKQEVQRIFNLRHSTKIDTVQRAIGAMGKNLEVFVTSH